MPMERVIITMVWDVNAPDKGTATREALEYLAGKTPDPIPIEMTIRTMSIESPKM